MKRKEKEFFWIGGGTGEEKGERMDGGTVWTTESRYQALDAAMRCDAMQSREILYRIRPTGLAAHVWPCGLGNEQVPK